LPEGNVDLPITMEKDYTPVYREIFERSNEQGWWAFNQPSLLQDKKDGVNKMPSFQ